MLSQLRAAALVWLVMTLLTGLAYPLLVTGLAQGLFPYQANGSLLPVEGKIAGSELIGQLFDSPRYFWSRPSATTSLQSAKPPLPYNAASSGGSNLSTENPAQLDAVTQRIKKLRDADPGNTATVPADLVTASGSGLDPHISVAAAEFQAARVARARGLSNEQIRQLIAEYTQPRQLGILGEPVVNVLLINLAMDHPQSRPKHVPHSWKDPS